jgi:hypothetical protein
MRGLLFLPLTLAAVAIMATGAFGSVVDVGLHNTGEGLVNPGDAEVNYLLSSAPGDVTQAYKVNVPGAWVSNAGWIGPDLSVQGSGDPQTALGGDPVGEYVYTTTFAVSDAILPWLVVTGQWATDNEADLYINVNGVPVSHTNRQAFGALTPFTITTGFISGENTLTFRVLNADDVTGSPPADGNPAGLLVTDLQATVPEPISLVVWSILGAVGAVFAWRRRK